MTQLKKLGNVQQIDSARLKAKELVRIRAHRVRLTGLKAGLSGLSQQLGEVGTNHKIQETLGKTTEMLQKLNGQLSLVNTQRLMTEFERQTSVMAAKQEIVDDALEMAFEGDNEQAETESAVLQVLEEAGLEAACKMKSVSANDRALMQGIDDSALESRLNSLRNG